MHNPRSAERGAVLVTSLLILLVLTIIGITAMQTTRMQERMAGNARDVSLAFQGAEAALRDAEADLEAIVTAPAKCTDASATCLTVYDRDVLPLMTEPSPQWWADVAREYGEAGVVELATDDLLEDPSYVVEELLDIRDCLEVTECGRRTVYQVTARSTGGSGVADVVLQTTFTKPPY